MLQLSKGPKSKTFLMIEKLIFKTLVHQLTMFLENIVYIAVHWRLKLTVSVLVRIIMYIEVHITNIAEHTMHHYILLSFVFISCLWILNQFCTAFVFYLLATLTSARKHAAIDNKLLFRRAIASTAVFACVPALTLKHTCSFSRVRGLEHESRPTSGMQARI